MVTKLEYARAMKLMGAPPNTPVDTRPFSEQYTTHWAAMMNAHADFMATLTRFVEEGGQSADKWWSVVRRCRALHGCDPLHRFRGRTRRKRGTRRRAGVQVRTG